MESRKGECGLRGLTVREDFDWFDINRQKTREGREQAKELLVAVKDWSAGQGPKWLVIVGDVGIAKTELAKTATWTSKRRGRWSYYIEAREFDKRVKDFRREWETATDGAPIDPDEWVRKLASVEVLIVDDIGAGYIDRGWTLSRFEALFDIRYAKQRPTLAVTNLDADGFKEHLGLRVWSRMWDGGLSRIVDCSAMTDSRPDNDDAEHVDW